MLGLNGGCGHGGGGKEVGEDGGCLHDDEVLVCCDVGGKNVE